MSPEEFDERHKSFELHGPKFRSTCPFAHCSQTFSGYTQKGVDALMAMHVDDHKRGIVSNKAERVLTPQDRAFLKEARIIWPEDKE